MDQTDVRKIKELSKICLLSCMIKELKDKKKHKEQAALMKYKILIIDDEEMILSMMEKCLKEKFSVYTANNAKKDVGHY